MTTSNGTLDPKKLRLDPAQVRAAREERRRNVLLWVVFGVGAVCVLPFAVALFGLLYFCCTNPKLNLYALGLNAALAIAFGGILLCVLLLFYRLRSEETAPSLTSGVIVIAIGAAMAVAISLAARGQLG